MNKRYTIILIYILLTFTSYSNDTTLNIRAQKIAIDNIGNIYSINDFLITKYLTNKQIKTFSIKTLGTLHHIDVTNGLRVLLYFKDFQKILFLDSQLSQNGDPIELSNLELEQTSLVGSSFNNGFWIYNQANNELLRFNQNMEITIKSGNIKRLLNIDIQPNFMVEHNGKLYLNSPNIGILLFDIYGAYLKTIPITQLTSFQIQYPYIFYAYADKFYSYNINTFETHTITEIPKDCKEIIYNGNNCYWHFTNSIKINNCIN